MDTRKNKDLILINLTRSRIIKGTFVCSVLLCISRFAESDVSYACGGSSGLPCTIHHITCNSPLVINIISTTYGYRSGCNDAGGPTVCINETCCIGQPNDCYIPFSNPHHQEVNAKCKEQSSCTLGGFLRNNTDSTKCSGQIVNAHSKINFNCNPVTEVNMTVTASLSTNETTTIQTSTISTALTSTIFTSMYMRQSSTERFKINNQDSRTLYILGGVLGTFLVISISIIVLLVVYFTRKIKIISKCTVPEQSNHNVDIAGLCIPTTIYDSLNTIGASAYYNIDNKTQESNPAQTIDNSSENGQCFNSANSDDAIYQNTDNHGQKQRWKHDSQIEPFNVNAVQGNMSNIYVNY